MFSIESILGRLVEQVEELAGIGAERLDIAPLALRVEGFENERTFAGAAQARDDHVAVERHVQVEALEVVLADAAQADALGSGRFIFDHDIEPPRLANRDGRKVQDRPGPEAVGREGFAREIPGGHGSRGTPAAPGGSSNGRSRARNASGSPGATAHPVRSGDETLADALGLVGDGEEPVGLALDQEIRERLAGGGVHGEVGRVVERGGVGPVAEKFHPVGEAETRGQPLARRTGRTVAREPKLPVRSRGQAGDDLHELPLVLFGPEHGDAQHHLSGGAGPEPGAQRRIARSPGFAERGKDERVANDGDFLRRQAVLRDEPVARPRRCWPRCGGCAAMTCERARAAVCRCATCRRRRLEARSPGPDPGLRPRSSWPCGPCTARSEGRFPRPGPARPGANQSSRVSKRWRARQATPAYRRSGGASAPPGRKVTRVASCPAAENPRVRSRDCRSVPPLRRTS